MKLITVLLALALCRAGLLQEAPRDPANPYRPTIMNDLPLVVSPDAGPYSFIVGGHLYGAPLNKKSIFPSASLLGNLDRINAMGSAFFVSLGDAIRFCLPKHYAMFRRSFADRLEMPLLNAVGNHDVAVRARYLKEFPGPTSGLFTHGKVLHLILDAEEDSGTISGQQLQGLLAMLEIAGKTEKLSSVAIYSHKLLWACGREKFDIVFQHLNSKDGYRADQSFVNTLLPPLRRLALQKQVIWFSGDIGCSHTLPLFYEKEPGVDLTWIATGIGDTADDSLLQVEVDQAGRMTPHVVRLDGTDSNPLSSFGLDYWKAHFKKK